MRPYRLIIALALALPVLAGRCCVAQQEFPPRTLPKKPDGSSEVALPDVEETLPPIRIMDQEGRLRSVPGITLEEIQRLLSRQGPEEGRSVRPRYSIQQLQATGRVAGQYAELAFEIKVATNADGWVRIPLRLAEAILQEAADYTGDGEHDLEFEADGGGYVAWIRGQAGATHTILLKTLVPVTSGAGGGRVKLTAPRANVSELKLVVPVADAVGKVTGGATLDEPRAGVSPDATELVARGLDGGLELAWRTAGTPQAESAEDLESIGAIAARIDGRSVHYTAHLAIRSFGGVFQSFRVQLPRDARLVESEQAGYTLAELPLPAGSSGPRVVEVQFDQKAAGPVECRIVAEQSIHPARPDDSLELSGFEVLGAVRQWGHVGVYIVGDWQIQWGPSESSVRRVEVLPDPLRREDLTAGFEYARQPFSLPARVVPRETRIHVDPEYLFLVGSEQIRLEARLKYKVRGAKVFQLEIDLPGWEIEDISPENLVMQDAVVFGQTAPLSIPLSQALAGAFDLTIRARRPAPPTGSPLDMPLPAPRATTVSPAAVVILADDNVELRPRMELISGLNRQRIAPAMKLPPRQQDPLFYRGEVTQSRFAADLNPRALSVDLRLHTRVELSGAAGRVEQRFSYVVANEPVTFVAIQAPRLLLDAGEVTFSLDGQKLQPRLSASPEDESPWVTLQLDLPAPRIGPFEITAGFALPSRDVFPNTTTLHEAPLLLPLEGRLERHDLEIVAGAGMSVQARGGNWKPGTGSPLEATEHDPLFLTTASPEPKLSLAVTLEDRPAGEVTIIDKAWLQTTLSPQGRTDRAVYRFTTQESLLELRLPAGARRSDVRVFLNGKPWPLESPLDSVLSVRLPRETSTRRHLLEILYGMSESPETGRLSFAAPQWSTPVWVQRFYWQLVLPAQQHLLVSPGNLAAEYQWRWDRLGFRRESSRDQGQLESWIGAPRRPPIAASSNIYLFSAWDGAMHWEARVAPRSLLVFTFSLAALVSGLVLIYVPAVRRGPIFLIAAVALAGGGVVYPDQAMLAAQASVVGVALAYLASWLERRVSSRRAPRTIARRASSSILRQRVVELQVGPLAGAGPSSTMTAALVIPPLGSGSDP